MKGIYHGYALGADAFVANTEEDALAEFSKRAGCEVRKCVYPVRSERVYCISYNGDLFGLIRDERKGAVLHPGAHRSPDGGGSRRDEYAVYLCRVSFAAIQV